MRKIDVFTHISPPGYSEGVERLAGNLKDIGKRSRGVPMLHDLDIRFRVMDMFPEYQQVLSLPTPPIELFAQPKEGIELARIANDSVYGLSGSIWTADPAVAFVRPRSRTPRRRLNPPIPCCQRLLLE